MCKICRSKTTHRRTLTSSKFTATLVLRKTLSREQKEEAACCRAARISAFLCFVKPNNDVLGGAFLTRSGYDWKMIVPTMRPNQSRTVLHVSVLAVLLLALNVDSADSGDEECLPEINVRRNTVHKALAGQELRINCTVVFCNSLKTVSWYKFENTSISFDVTNISHIKTEWKTLKELEGISFLIFQNILRSDSGQYQCRSGRETSHIISVIVYGDDKTTSVPPKDSTTDSLKPNDDFPENLLIYVYSAAGIATFVIIVIILTVILMRGCKGNSQKKSEQQTDSQYVAIPMAQQPFPHAGLQPSPRGSPAVPPPRRSTRRKRPTEPPSARDGAQVCGQESEDRDRQRNTAEEEISSVVYASLNHQLPPRPAPRTRRLVDESSEYAAIRVA
ncbi:B- and T-lymphocyte attenuator-like [Acanthochromis polyacanthus]|uniref:B- and T-lymphocyte attenuator-like n=1 Tax=Acanthochromis polyacanthus TaxID=80966 RepID=UPI002234AAFF|nr:B- and T-lymphocyte attenuator-like [Acanthochromis polyacanthus]